MLLMIQVIFGWSTVFVVFVRKLVVSTEIIERDRDR